MCLIETSEHYFEPFFEGTGPCWCSRGRDHRLHNSQRRYLDTPEGRAAARSQELGTNEANKAYWSLHRRNNLISLTPLRGRC